MERENLYKYAPTAQVRILAEELLSDGKAHLRRELVEYVKGEGARMGLPSFREGHIAGGIREATTNLNCIKVGRGEFQIESPTDNVQGKEAVTLGKRLAEVCEDAQVQLINISKEIVYVNASDDELKTLEKVRKCIQILKEYQEVFKTE